jgi:hypothetical protein
LSSTGFDAAKKKKFVLVLNVAIFLVDAKLNRDSNEKLDPGATRRSGRNQLKRRREEDDGEDGTSAKKNKPSKPSGKAAPKPTGSTGGRKGTSSNRKK